MAEKSTHLRPGVFNSDLLILVCVLSGQQSLQRGIDWYQEFALPRQNVQAGPAVGEAINVDMVTSTRLDDGRKGAILRVFARSSRLVSVVKLGPSKRI